MGRYKLLLAEFVSTILFLILALPTILYSQNNEELDSWIYVEPYPLVLYDQELTVPAGSRIPLTVQFETARVYDIEVTVSSGGNRDIDFYLFSSMEFETFNVGGLAKPFLYRPRLTGQEIFTFRSAFLRDHVIVISNSFSILSSKTVHIVITEKGSDVSAEAKKGLKETYLALKRTFIFPNFKMNLKRCGTANAYGGPEFTYCYELLEHLHRSDPENAFPVSLFVMFHEFGHTLLYQWQYPLWDNEDAADEFATVFLMMGNQEKIAEQAAEWWWKQWTLSEWIQRYSINDRHALSRQRSRNIMSWISRKDELITRWQRILIPKMQTDELVSNLEQNAPYWIDKQLITDELQKRKLASTTTTKIENQALDGIYSEKYQQTLSLLQLLCTKLDQFKIRNGTYPALPLLAFRNNSGNDWSGPKEMIIGQSSVSEITTTLGNDIPVKDAWGNDIYYYLSFDERNYWLISTGDDAQFDENIYWKNGLPQQSYLGSTNSASADIIYSNGKPIRFLALIQNR